MRPTFNNAVEHCKDISNVHWADDERTYQDKCIDEFFNGKEDSIITMTEMLWVVGLLLSIVGIAFIVPLSIYLLLSWRKYKYGYY